MSDPGTRHQVPGLGFRNGAVGSDRVHDGHAEPHFGTASRALHAWLGKSPTRTRKRLTGLAGRGWFGLRHGEPELDSKTGSAATRASIGGARSGSMDGRELWGILRVNMALRILGELRRLKMLA